MNASHPLPPMMTAFLCTMAKKFLLSCFFLTLLRLAAFSQDSGTLTVVLRDQNDDIVNVGILSVIDEKGKKAAEIDISKSPTTAIINLRFGTYTLTVQSPGFKTYQQQIEIENGTNKVEVQLEIEDIVVDIKVEQDEREKRIDEAFSGFLTDREIASLPESGEDIREELKRRYGDDILIRIDGDFDGSQIPSREQISSIKVIRNSFDAEFHEIAGIIIDIRTKVVTDGIHGFVNFSFNNSILNARNPFDLQRQPERKRQLILFLSGPIIKNKTAFSFSTFGISSSDTQNFIGTVANTSEIIPPKLKNNISFSTFSVKHNLPKEHILDFKYQRNSFSFFRLGPFDLPERGSTFSNPRHTFSVTESGTFKGKYFNELRFEFGKEFRKTTPESDEITIIVLESFNRGGSGTKQRDEKTKFKLADNLVFDLRKHSLKFGAEIEYNQLQNVSENNVNGRFIFSSLANFENQNPSQYSQTIGATNVELSQTRASFYIQDYFKFSKTLQLSLGLRYEWQNDLDDRNNFSPRIGFVWSPEKSGKLIVRGGIGVFYDWLDTQILSSILSNDSRQGQNLIIINPGFPDPFDGGAVSQPLPISVSRLADNLTNPYVFATQNAFNYKLNKSVTFEGIYTFKRGLHHFRSRNINAPVNDIRPNPDFGRIQLLESGGASREHSFNLKINAYYKGVNIFSNYQLESETADFSDALSLPTDNFNLRFDRGPTNFNQLHKLNLSFNLDVWKNLKISPSFKLESGFPYTITTGRDNNGDTVFNDRPFGIGRNSERGEWLQQTDLRLQWKLSLKYLGLKGKNEKRPINLQANIRNLFNTTNLINFVGVQTSPFFRQATLARNSRSIDLGLSFAF